MQILSSDLVPFIPDHTITLALLRVLSATWTREPGGQYETGQVSLEAVEVFRGDLKSGETVHITGRRLASEEAREKGGPDQWNTLPFEQGNLLAMALRRTVQTGPWTALAAEDVASPQDPLVAGLRRAVEIDAMPPPSRPPALAQALHSPSELLRNYAIDRIGKGAAVSRDAGAVMLEVALAAPDLPAQSRLPLGKALTTRYFYHFEAGPDAANQAVVRALARLLVTDTSRRSVWTQFLASCILIELSKDPQKDAEMRAALIRSVTAPTPAEMRIALEREATTGKDPRASRLLSAWK